MGDDTKFFIFLIFGMIIVFAALIVSVKLKNDFELQKLQISCTAKKG